MSSGTTGSGKAKSYGTEGAPLLKPDSEEVGHVESHGMGKAGTSTLPEASFNMINSIVRAFNVLFFCEHAVAFSSRCTLLA